ncbi:MAG TPA: ATP-binding protein [Caulobacteraceae bacterium]
MDQADTRSPNTTPPRGTADGAPDYERILDGDIDLTALKPSLDRIVRVAMTLFGTPDGEVTILRPGQAPWRSKGGNSLNTSFTDMIVGRREVVWIEDLRRDEVLARSVEPHVARIVRFGAGAPICLASGESLGVLTVLDTEPRPFDARLARRLQDLADLIADDWERHRAVLGRARAEAEARAARATLASVVSAAPVALLMTDRELRVIQGSPRWFEERRFTPEQVIGKSLYDILPGSRERWSAAFDRALAGQSVRGDRIRLDLPDGRTVWIRSEHTPWRDGAGEIGGLMMMSVDITDVVNALEESERSEKRLTLASEIGEVNIWEVDFRRHELNGLGWKDRGFAEAKIGYEDMANDLWRVVHPDDRAEAEALWERHLNEGAPFRMTYRLLQGDAPDLWVQSAIEGVRDENGELVRILGVLRNIDAEKRAELALASARDAAETANRAKSEFLANMSHEIRTPLNGVMGVASALGRTELSASQREMVGLIEASAHTLEALLSDVLDLARIEAGRLEIKPEPFDPLQAVRDVGGLFAAGAEAKGLGFHVEIDPETAAMLSSDVVPLVGAPLLGPPFLGDVARLRQILSNLLSNAVKFTAAGCVKLSFAARPDGDALAAVFRVTDTGIGFDDDTARRLFDRFEQADGSITRRFGGSGLGLAISRSLAEAMGGRLSATSVPGVGSVFELQLPFKTAGAPAAAVDDEPQDESEPGPADPLRLASLAVLLAEDHPTNRRVVQLILGSAGVEPVCVENGAEAVEAWTETGFDLVLMDMQMPVMDGLTAISAIRRREAALGRARTTILALTANAMPEDVEATRAAGADGHLTKPITAAALLSAVREAAAARALGDHALERMLG